MLRVAMLLAGLTILAAGAPAPAAGAPPAAATGIAFGPPIEIPGADRSRAVAVADVTGDGRNDVVLAGYEDAQVVVHPGNGDGTFGAAQTTATTNSHVLRILVGRLNADAVDDLVLCQESAASLEVLVSDGSGGLVPTAFVDGPSGAFTYAEVPALMDWDGDGDVDLVYRIYARGMGVRANDGAGNFGAWQSVSLPNAWGHIGYYEAAAGEAVAGDFDGDGDVDLLSSVANGQQAFWRQADGTFTGGTLPGAYPGPDYRGLPAWTSAADLDGDGFADFLGVYYGESIGHQFMHIGLLQHTSGTTYQRPSGTSGIGSLLFPTNVSRSPQGPIPVDLNGDGRPELVTPRGVLLPPALPRNGGWFSITNYYPVQIALPTTGLPLGVAVGDLTGDGRPDIVTVTDADSGSNVAALVIPLVPRTVVLSSIAPATLYAGGTVDVVVTGSGFLAGETLDLGPGVTVSGAVVESPTAIRAKVAVDARAPLGVLDLGLSNVDGARAALASAATIVSGGVATIGALSPDSGHAGGTYDIDVAGAGFLEGASASFGAGATVHSVSVAASGHLRVNVTFELTAALGPRTLSVVNGSGIATDVTGAFTLLQPPTIDLDAHHGRLRPSSRPERGTFTVSGTFKFDAASPDGVFDPATESGEIRFGDPRAPIVVRVPVALGWRVRGGRAEWRTPRRTAGPSVRLVLDLGRSTFRLDVERVDVAAPGSGDVVVDLTLGNDSGFSIRPWETVRRGGGLVLR